MAIVSQSEFSRLAGISRSAVSKSIKLGRLVATAEGMDTEHPTNAAYLRLTQGMVKTGGRPTMGGRAGNSPTAAMPRQETRGAKPGKRDQEYKEIADVAQEGKVLDNRIKMVRYQKEKLSYFELIRQTVPLEIVTRTLARIGAVMDEHFRMFDQRVGDQLYETVQSGKPKEVFNQAIRDEIDRSMKSIVKTIQKETEGLKVQQ